MLEAEERAQQIERFVVRFLAGVGARVERRCGGLTAELPREAAALLDCDTRLSLCFTERARESGCEYITFGHPLLDRMLAVARSRGRAANLLFPFVMEPDFAAAALQVDPFAPDGSPPGLAGDEGRLLAAMAERGRSLRVEGAHLRILSRRLLHQRQILFHFNVSLVADERREMTVSLFIDPVTERVDRPVDVRGAVSFIPWDFSRDRRGSGEAVPAGRAKEQEAYCVDRMYRRACEHLRSRLEPQLQAFSREAAQRARAECRRIEEYYRGLAEESLEPLRKLFRRIAAAGVRADLARSWHTQNRYAQQAGALKEEARRLEAAYRQEVQALSREKERRLAEVAEKYRPRAEIRLTHGAFVMVPRVEWRLRIEQEGRSREAVVLYDLLRQRFVGWECESCSRPLCAPAHLCSCEALVCSACYSSCSGCGEGRCSLCAEERCHLCRGFVCSRCDTACPLGTALEGVELPSVCPACRSQWCRTCLKSALPHWDGATGLLLETVEV